LLRQQPGKDKPNVDVGTPGKISVDAHDDQHNFVEITGTCAAVILFKNCF